MNSKQFTKEEIAAEVAARLGVLTELRIDERILAAGRSLVATNGLRISNVVGHPSVLLVGEGEHLYFLMAAEMDPKNRQKILHVRKHL